MQDAIVVDVEIARRIEELPNGWDDTHLMGLGCAVVYEERTDRYRLYGPEDVEALQARLLEADLVGGFNTHRFDANVIWRMPRAARVEDFAPKVAAGSVDLLRIIWQALGLDPDRFHKATHGGWGLDAVARGTLGDRGKTGHGALAPVWFQEGRLCRLHSYCLDDVWLERDLLRFARRYGYVVNGDTGQVLRLPREPLARWP